MSDPVQDVGAHFHRTDLQVHTPRDNQWKGPSFTTDADRDAYAVDFVAACRSKSLEAVAITDHHDFTFFPHIKKAAEGEVDADGQPIPGADRLTVFPGLELTLAVPCQAILILDAGIPLDRLSSVLEALAIEPHDPTEPRLAPVTRLDHIQTLEDLYSALDTRPWLRGHYIVLPNVTDGGLGTLMRSGMQAKYKNMPCVGGYLDGTVAMKAKPGSGNRRKLDGLDPAWGNKRLALFQTSDSRSSDLARLGEHSTWAKWAEPSAEALRQACLAEESRLSQTPPALPSVFVSALHVSNSGFLGPVDLYLNPQYNAIIGGRGTGKSTVLDYIRWCLADTSTADLDDELPSLLRQRRLIEATLKSLKAHVEVDFTINGIPHVVRRDAATGEINLQVGDGKFAKATEASIQSLLPIQAYSQKQLSSVSVRLDELTRFVTAPIRRDLESKDAAIEEVSDKLRENYGSLQRARGLARTIEREQLAEGSLLAQATHIRKSLAGLSTEDQVTLSQRPAVDRSREAVRAWEQAAEQAESDAVSLVARLRRLGMDLRQTSEDAPPVVRQPLAELRAQTHDDIEKLATSIGAALQEQQQSSSGTLGRQRLASSIRASVAEFDQQYDEVRGRSTTHEEQLRELTDIEARRTELTAALSRQSAELAELGDPASRHQALRRDLVRLGTERSQLLSAQCAFVTELSGGLLEAIILRGQGFEEVERRFRSLSSGSAIRSSRLESLFGALIRESDAIATWETILTELEALLLAEEGVNLTSETTPNLTRLEFPLPDQQRLRSRMTVDGWLDLALTPIRDTPRFRYETKAGEYISFEAASAGQQATALLKVLLSQSGMPLIIDQPEDDLDSQVIQDVVTWMWDAKAKRQVIFASHNANLVVNGDAELVVICDYRRAGDQSGGKIKLQGAIDVPEVRHEIAHVMEGGERAFKLRKSKYGF